jgi:membrane associated rhomboid family serine protease
MDSLTALFGTSPVAATLLALILVASLVGLYAAPSLIERGLFRPHWFLPQREFATPVTSAFLHADLPHLAFNGFTFWAFGFALEGTIGSIKFGLLYAVGIAVSSVGTWMAHRNDPAYRTLGASGAILAVLFASIVYNPSASIFILPIPVPIPAPVFAVLYLGYTVWASRQTLGRVNHDAHLSGALAGIGFVVLVDPGAVAQAWSRLVG